MKYPLIFHAALDMTIAASICVFSSTAQAHSLCKGLGQHLDPTMQCSHTHFVGRTPAPSIPVGYFDNGATVFYTKGNLYCGFASPKHLQFFQQVNPAGSLGRRDPKSFGTYTGACDLPSGYFDNGATVFFSLGNGEFCGFRNPQSLASHQSSRPRLPKFGRIDRSPNDFMDNKGVCQ
jgi:hypothetical protein